MALDIQRSLVFRCLPHGACGLFMDVSPARAQVQNLKTSLDYEDLLVMEEIFARFARMSLRRLDALQRRPGPVNA